MAMYFLPQLSDSGVKELFIQFQDYFIPIHDITSTMEAEKIQMLPFLHALSGCDTTSFFFGKGKKNVYSKALADNDVKRSIGACCKNLQASFSGEVVESAQNIATSLLIRVYSKSPGQFNSLNELRANLYATSVDRHSTDRF